MTIQKRTVERYYWRCPACDREFTFGDKNEAESTAKRGRCDDCEWKRFRAERKAEWMEEHQFLIGAKVEEIVGDSTNELWALLVLGTDGTYYRLEASGWEERYIRIQAFESGKPECWY